MEFIYLVFTRLPLDASYSRRFGSGLFYLLLFMWRLTSAINPFPCCYTWRLTSAINPFSFCYVWRLTSTINPFLSCVPCYVWRLTSASFRCCVLVNYALLLSGASNSPRFVDPRLYSRHSNPALKRLAQVEHAYRHSMHTAPASVVLRTQHTYRSSVSRCQATACIPLQRQSLSGQSMHTAPASVALRTKHAYRFGVSRS